MPIIIDVDREWQNLAQNQPGGELGALPRKSVYGSAEGLIPFGDAYLDKLVDPKDYKEVIAHCHAMKIFPMYHEKATWLPPGGRWNQNGLPYCWAWGMTSSFQNCRAQEGKKPIVQLAPVSLGFTVNWQSRGNYLESAINGARTRGIAPAEYVPSPFDRNYRNYKSGWEEAALNFRLGEVVDTDSRNMIQHCISILALGKPLYIAYNWWSHALQAAGVIWDESQPNNLRWVIQNSHNEDDFIELVGSKGIPSEAYGIMSTLTLAV